MGIKEQLDSSEIPLLELNHAAVAVGGRANGTAQLIFRVPLKMIFCRSFTAARLAP